jgi:hypothetical protein
VKRRAAGILALGLVGAPAAARAAGGPFGLGIILGEPTGLSAKYFISGRNAIDAALDFSFLDDAFYFQLDYIWHFGSLSRSATWLPYVGVGGKVFIHDNHDDDDKHHHHHHDTLGIRVPLGIAFMPRSVPIDVFGEIVPGIELLPETDPDIAGGLGVRFFF